jgi:tol-pal system protein YbgF
LARYPRDGLAGNAQYWLGESYFVRGQFKPAAQAFLKGYQTYAGSPKAPDSLFKLAVSLDRMGQKNDACATFGELLQKFPTAPANIKSRAQTERQRLGCA